MIENPINVECSVKDCKFSLTAEFERLFNIWNDTDDSSIEIECIKTSANLSVAIEAHKQNHKLEKIYDKLSEIDQELNAVIDGDFHIRVHQV